MIKEKTINQVYNSVIRRNSIFFVSMTAFMFCVLSDNLNNTLNGLWLLLFFALISSFWSCVFEIRIVRKTGEFLMPTARIFMFLSKPIMLILGYVVMILSFKSTMENNLKYLSLCLYIIIATSFFYFGVIMLFRKKEKREVCYIDYTLKKLTRSKNQNSALVGIIATTILLIVVVALFAFYFIKQRSDHFSIYDDYIIIGFIIISSLLIGSELYYIHEFIKKIKAENSALNKEEKENEDETNDR